MHLTAGIFVYRHGTNTGEQYRQRSVSKIVELYLAGLSTRLNYVIGDEPGCQCQRCVTQVFFFAERSRSVVQ